MMVHVSFALCFLLNLFFYKMFFSFFLKSGQDVGTGSRPVEKKTPLQSAKTFANTTDFKKRKNNLQRDPWNYDFVEEHGWHPVDH